MLNIDTHRLNLLHPLTNTNHFLLLFFTTFSILLDATIVMLLFLFIV